MGKTETVDVAVVGFGAAGASAALEARAGGASVLVLDRFGGGGATAISGGVVYAGGGTRQQDEAGVTDSVGEMYRYLKLENDGVVSDSTLQLFCEESKANLEWLEGHGVPLASSLCPFKTSYPSDRYYLYYSGSEQARPFSDEATPAPRGHRVHSSGNTSGKTLFRALSASVTGSGARIQTQAIVDHLIVEREPASAAGSGGTVVGLEYRTFPAAAAAAARVHRMLSARVGKVNLYFPWGAIPINATIRRLERQMTERRVARAREGVVLCAGGFGFNKSMLADHAPQYLGGRPIGTIADDGSGIRLGQQAGGATDLMDRVSAWRFINPPSAMARGVLVGPSGARVCNELFYGARVADHIINQHGGKAWLVCDAATVAQVRQEAHEQSPFFMRPQIDYLLSPVGHTKAGDLATLARKLAIDPAALTATVSRFNEDARAGRDDAMGKTATYVSPLLDGPFYAFDCSHRESLCYPCPMITVGGLAVDEVTGQVLGQDRAPIGGLYAAGRTAVGICSGSYVSGLSLADCVFSGRRAGRTLSRQSLRSTARSA